MRAEVDKADLTSVKLLLSGIHNGYPKVMTRSMNKTFTSTRTFACREITKDLNLTVTRVRKDFTIRKANWSNLKGNVTAKGKPVGLISFRGTRQVKKGVSVLVHKSKKRSVISHAFIQTARNAENVFWRAYTGPRSQYRPTFPYARLPRHYRYPVHRKTGPRIEDEYAKPKVFDPTVKHADKTFDTNMERELSYLLSQHK